ncbi:MAG: glycosyltransferase family 2 protein [Chloroflexi bacterium]|nr:glycosyltransferase family 2 protein [Chloroflexota bacterium]
MSLFSIVVPVYHNASSLGDLLAELQAVADKNPEDDFEFIFVDDGSADDSFAVLEKLADRAPQMKVVKLSRNFGSNPAIMAGMSQASGDAVAAIAADLQDPPALLHDMIELWRGGHKVIIAARRGRQDPFPTSLLSDVFYRLFRRYAIKTMPERGFDFFLIDRQVCALINDIQENNAYLMGLILWLGFDPYVLYYDRQTRKQEYGQSMWSLKRKLKYFVDSFVAFSYFPIRLASALGLLFSMLGLLYTLWVIYARLALGIAAEGWASLMIVVLIAAGVQMLILGIVGEYMWRSLDETRRRPRFIIEKIIENERATEDPDGSAGMKADPAERSLER